MNKLNFALMIIAGFLVMGCASFPEADEKSETLVIGHIALEAKGWRSSSAATVNGVKKSGIEITMQNINDNKKYVMKSRRDGLFYSNKIPEGRYKITKLYYRNSSGKSWASLRWNPRALLSIHDGWVNNLGIIEWQCVHPYASLSCNREFEQVKDSFQEEFNLSNWNEKKWLNTGIR